MTKIFLILIIVLGLVISQSHAAITDSLTTIKLETSVHFVAPDGSDLPVEAGIYTIEPAEEWIRLMSGERHDAVLIEAIKASHELELEEPMGLSVPGETEEEKDLHHIMLLLPGGQSLDAIGTYSGIRSRGSLSKAQQAKKDAIDAIAKMKKSMLRAKANRKHALARNSALRSLMIALKQSAERAEWQAEKLRSEVEDMKKDIKKKKQNIRHKLKNRSLAGRRKYRLQQELKKLEDTYKKLVSQLRQTSTRATRFQQALSKTKKAVSHKR